MNLAHDSEFVRSSKTGGGRINSLIKFVKQFIDWTAGAGPLIDSDAALEETAVENFLNHLSIYREDVVNVINVTFASQDPIKAAYIVNAIADTYIATSLETKLASTKMVSQWLQDRLMELSLQATSADRALQDYKAANNLVNVSTAELDNLMRESR
jgi:succinoglycan biosynthesis transport protein ExoP